MGLRTLVLKYSLCALMIVHNERRNIGTLRPNRGLNLFTREKEKTGKGKEKQREQHFSIKFLTQLVTIKAKLRDSEITKEMRHIGDERIVNE